MKLERINGTQATTVEINGMAILYSYKTPVALRFLKNGLEYRTSKKWSVTTSKHINAWCNTNATLVDQELLEAMITNEENQKNL